ncbi:MAG: 3-ketoacyl-ACP reductase [Isosphaeraceae bacterium]
MPKEDSVAIITGGSRGLGRGIVIELAKLGKRLVVNYRSDSRAAEEARAQALEVGAGKVETIQADIGDLDQAKRLLDQTLSVFGRVDLLVNNAGIAPKTRLDLLETTPESFDRLLSTNFRGPFFLTQMVARTMLELILAKVVSNAQIQFITSISSEFASINRGEYCMSKAATSMAAKLFAARLAGQGIQVFEIRPGIIETDMTANVRELYDARIAAGLSPIARWGTPNDVGKVSAALADGAFPFSTGNIIYVDGGLHLPRL